MDSTALHAERAVLVDLQREFTGSRLMIEELRTERDPRRNDGSWRVVGLVVITEANGGTVHRRHFRWFDYRVDSATGSIEERHLTEQ